MDEVEERRKTIGERIRRARLLAKYSQRQLATRCGATIGGAYRMPPPAIGTRGPPTAEVRYFHEGEESYAQDVAQRLQGCLGAAPAVRLMPGFDATPPLI